MTELETLIINDYPELIEVMGIIDEQFLNKYNKNCSLEYNLYFYALHVIEDKWPEAEPYMMKDPRWAYYYALHIIKGRWPEAEKYIIKNVQFLYYYASCIIKAQWPEA